VIIPQRHSDTRGDTPFHETMKPHQHSQISDVITLPMLLIVAFAAWTATFLSGHTPTR